MSNRPKLIVMCGLSASGKSTVAKELAVKHDAAIVSSDAIREELCGSVSDQSKNEEVFKIFHKRIRKYLHEKRNVIADATNINMKARRVIINNVKKMDVEIIAYIIPKRVEDCVRDNIDRKHPVPEEVIYKQEKRFQIPFIEEGFDKIIIHDFGFRYKLDQLNMIEEMYGFNQKNPHHNMDLGTHCSFTYNLFTSGRSTIYSYEDGFYMGARLHDIGKLFTQIFDEDGIAHYYNHSSIGSYYVLSNSYNSNEELEDKTQFLLDCCFLINYHMFPFSWNTDSIKNKWKRRFGEYKYDMLMRFHECDVTRLNETLVS